MTELHPRPNFCRDDWIDLRGKWQFAYDDENRGLDAGWQRDAAPFDREIIVPFPPESDLSGIGDKSYHPTVWYRLDADKPVLGDGRLLLHFGAIDYRAQVWVNGDLIATHTGGHTPFSADITAAAGLAERVIIVVRAEDDPLSPGQPRGKQDWQPEPHAIWYNRTTGIWQPVWMECVPQFHTTGIHFSPDPANGRVTAELAFNRALPAGAVCDLEVSIEGEMLVRQSVSVNTDHLTSTLHIPGLEHGQALGGLLWSPDRPNLMHVEVRLHVDGQKDDVSQSYFGMRSCGTDHGRFTLNDKPFFVRSVLEQGYWPQSHLAAPDDAAIRREVEWIKELGFNAVRIHQKVEDPRFLYWCDRLGLLVWGEMPGAYAYSPQIAARFTREWMEAVERDRSHPCIVTWVPLNESWGIGEIARRDDQRAFASAMYHLTKALDPTRPVISNDGWELMETDIVGVHDYSVEGAQLAERYQSESAAAEAIAGFGPQRRRILLKDGQDQQPVMITEFGGVSYHPAAGEAWFGYGTVANLEEYLASVEGLFDGLHASPALAGYCYTQLTDTLQEKNGLLDENRQPKLPVEAIRDIILRPSEAIPAEYLDIERLRAMRSSSGEENQE